VALNISFFSALSLLIVVYLLSYSFVILAFIYSAPTPTYTSFSCFPAIRFASHAKYIRPGQVVVVVVRPLLPV
jgi:hypothetical protein